MGGEGSRRRARLRRPQLPARPSTPALRTCPPDRRTSPRPSIVGREIGTRPQRRRSGKRETRAPPPIARPRSARSACERLRSERSPRNFSVMWRLFSATHFSVAPARCGATQLLRRRRAARPRRVGGSVMRDEAAHASSRPSDLAPEQVERASTWLARGSTSRLAPSSDEPLALAVAPTRDCDARTTRVPTGLSAVPPSGPAMPVTATQTSAPKRSRRPRPSPRRPARSPRRDCASSAGATPSSIASSAALE